MIQDATRRSFEHYLEESGVKLKFVADRIGCHYSSLAHWRSGDRDFHQDLYQRLVKFLLERKVKL